MKLYLMRHGPAEDRAPSGVDGDRALTVVGRERVRNVAKFLLTVAEEPLHILSSPLVRAVQTAEVVAVVTKFGDHDGIVEVRRELAPGGDVAGLARHLPNERKKRVMLVGHEPDLSAAAAALLGDFTRPFEKAMVVGAQLANGATAARLRFVLDPKELRFDPDLRA